MNESVEILDLPVGSYTMSSLLDQLEILIHKPGCSAAYGLNAHSFNLTYQYPQFYHALCRADLLYADGASLLLAARLLRKRLPEKLTTTDVWPAVCALATRKNYSFFLLGGEPGLAERAREETLKQWPYLNIVGTHHGYFQGKDEEVISLINEKKPDILWVGTGEPGQAVWVEQYRDRLDVSLAITCGGMFKIVAGELRRLPGKWRQRGFEWLYRMVQEPQTASRYLLGLPLFGSRILAQCFKAPMP
ncbi:MAG: WecB/TagA/CpsF family glycosyltransferase [Syntrophobacteraceae bacterium]